ncbi:hypothetical protein ENBRE01_2157 [Enteropsectra breve]|nr:hypothetical protein ENBRE01_2157 [Enteropsectra breve]
MFQFKRPAIYAVIRKYRTSQSIYLQPYGGSHNKKLNDEHEEFIRGCIDADCEVTLKTLKQHLLLQFGIDVSISTINRCISSFSYTFKRIHWLPQRRNDPDVIFGDSTQKSL